jgi:putative DNA primase/helicase
VSAATDFVAALERAGRDVRQTRPGDWMAQCPAHDDGRPSLRVSEAPDGAALIVCYADCENEAICAALGLTLADLFPPRPEQQTQLAPARTEVESYTYRDENGEPLFQVVRFEPKDFRQRRWTGSRYEWGLGDTRRVLWRLPELLQAKQTGKWIFLTEGEKDAKAAVGAGQCGTTLPGGAGKWRPEYTKTLTGANVVIVADDDEPGRKHANEVYRALYGKAKVGVRLPAEGCKDLADHLARGFSLNGDLRKSPDLESLAPDGELAADKPRRGALTAAFFASRAGSAVALEVVGPLFQRGMRTAIGAQTGEGKTTFALHAVKALVEGEPFLGEDRWRPRSKGRALIVDLEQGEETIKARLRDVGLDTSDRVEILWEPSGIALDKREEDRAMVEDVLSEGQYDLVALDPMYQMHLGSGNDETVAAATMRIVDEWARKYNAAFVIRDEGFKRNYKEQRDKVKKSLRDLLQSDDGATREQLLGVEGADEVMVQEVLRRAHRNGDRFRTRKWPEEAMVSPGQTALMDP